MELRIASHGAWLRTDNENDVHVYVDQRHAEIAINDPSVVKQGQTCPLALSLETDKATLQVMENGTPKFYDIPLKNIAAHLRLFLMQLKASYAK